MSTSDAGELEQRVVGGGRAAPQCGTALSARTTTARERRDEPPVGRKSRNEETPADLQLLRQGIRREEIHRAPALRADGLKKDDSLLGTDSDLQIRRSHEPRFTSSLVLRLSGRIKNRKVVDSSLQSAIEPQPSEGKDSRLQVNGKAASLQTSIDQTSKVHSPTEILPRQGQLIRVPGKEKDSSITHRFTNGDLRTQEHHSSCVSHPGTHTGSLTGAQLKEDIRNHKKLENRADFKGLSEPSSSRMLSSSVVTALTPPWTGLIRRPKKQDGSSDAQGNLQDPSTNRAQGFQGTAQYAGEGTSAGGSQMRRPLLGPRSNTVGWSTKADLSTTDFHRKLSQTVSLDGNTVKMDTGAISPLNTSPSPASPSLLDQNEQRNNLQTNQARLSALSSKPTTSSLLLSLRRFNSNGRNSNTATTLSNSNASPNDQNGKLFSTHLSQSFLNNNEQEKPKPMLSPSSLSYRTPEPGPVHSPSSANQREMNKSDTRFFPTPISRESDNTTMNNTHSSQGFLNKRQQNYRASDKGSHLLSETSVTVPRHSSYDNSLQQKPPSVPRATLTSTSWWKQVTQEGNSLARNNPTSVKDKPNTPLTPPGLDHRGLASLSPTDNKKFSQIHNNRVNNSITESLLKSNIRTQGGAADLKQRNAENTPDHESGRLVMQQYGSNLNNRELQKTYSMPDVSFTSKLSRAPSLTVLSHLRDSNKHDASNGAAELPPPLLSPRSPNTPTENNNHRPPKSNSPPTSHMNTQQFRQSLSPVFTATTPGLSPASNTKSSLSFYPVSSQTKFQYSSSQTPKLIDKVITTPLGFERNYASIPKPSHSKTVSSLKPTVASFSKTSYNSTSPTSVASSSTTSGHPATTNPSLLSPSITPSRTPSPTVPTSITSLLTPPATPNATNTTSPKGGRTFSNSLERDCKKKGGEAKRARRVTWDESVDLQCSESAKVEKQETSPVPNIPVSPSRSPRNTPSIFSFLRPGSPTCSPDAPNTSSTQLKNGAKYRSLSSDTVDLASTECEKSKQRNGDVLIFDKGRQGVTTPMQERTLSVESGTAQCRSSAPLSLPPDFSRNYKLRYSSPPYSTLMSSRLAQGETKPIMPRSPLFPQPPQSHYSLTSKTDKTILASKPPLSPTKAFELMPLPFQKQTTTKDNAKCDKVNNNHDRNNIQPRLNGQLQLVNNRVNFGSQSLQGDKSSHSSSFVTETLIYSIKPKVNAAPAALKSTTPKPLQHIANTPVSVETQLSQHSHTVQSREAAAGARGQSDQSSSGSSSTDSQSLGGMGSRSVKDSVLGKSRFFSMDDKNEQSPKKSRFTLKKSVSTPNATLKRSESERVSKSGNRMDQVFNKLKQRFSTKRPDDDSSFPWKWRRGSQTPSVSSEVSNVSDNSVESAKTLEERVQEKELTCDDAAKKNTDDADGWTQNRYAIIPSSAVGRTASRDEFSGWSENSASRTEQQELSVTAEDTSESKVQLRVHSPTVPQFDFYLDNCADFNTTNQLFPCRDPSPCRSPNASGVYPVQPRRSTPSPRSPFSPFASLSPVSPFAAPDPADDNVFYSPKLQRRRDTPSPCEQGEVINLRPSRKSRASTGPPSIGPGQDRERLASSYADLKYGIEPGKSFSVSSVLSSRPSGPGRISTGSRFMSVGDLSHSALSPGGNSAGLDRWSMPPDGASDSAGQLTKPHHLWNSSCDLDKFRSRSLPRSLTKCLANWSSETTPPQAFLSASSKPARRHSPNVDICHFTWEAEGPPTPPPTPPLSPVSRRMSKPPSLSSPTFPSTSGTLQADRAHLRSYSSSLSTFEESSDSSSDTTTDDEYYLEADETGEKETEL
ncbi:mucin-12 [Salarias fasciatus]|uniref:mucin-12 n=1 Tax=Salarias fasciatus TaxID=181472 RepID=UPI001176560C|nr:mucin-12-like [Salarias fasciatus]